MLVTVVILANTLLGYKVLSKRSKRVLDTSEAPRLMTVTLLVIFCAKSCTSSRSPHEATSTMPVFVFDNENIICCNSGLSEGHHDQ
jgi:hypothetical protein